MPRGAERTGADLDAGAFEVDNPEPAHHVMIRKDEQAVRGLLAFAEVGRGAVNRDGGSAVGVAAAINANVRRGERGQKDTRANRLATDAGGKGDGGRALMTVSLFDGLSEREVWAAIHDADRLVGLGVAGVGDDERDRLHGAAEYLARQLA